MPDPPPERLPEPPENPPAEPFPDDCRSTGKRLSAAADGSACLRFELGPALGLLGIRIWLGVRALAAGVEKYAGRLSSEELVEIDGSANDYGLTDAASEKVYGMEHYHGIPAALRPQFEAEPLMAGPMLDLYDKLLGPVLLLLGVTVLLGVLPRISLFAMGLLYTSLTFGLVLIGQEGGVAWLAIHMALIGLALVHADRDRFVLLGRKW